MHRVRLASLVMIASLVGACGGASPSVNVSPLTTVAPSTASEVHGLIDVGGHSLFYSCQGAGSPTVIMEHGLGGDIRDWTDVFRVASDHTRVCDYSRANAKNSDAVPGTHTAADSVSDLRALLANAKVTGPYVIVGYSWGGLIAQLFAQTYPADVVGMVLVDSNNAEEADTYWAHLTPDQVAADKAYTAGPNPESVDILASYDLVRAAPAVPDVPLIVVTHTVADPNEWPPGWDPTVFDGLQAGLQAGLVKLTSKGRQVFATGRGHEDILGDPPEVVVQAIRDVVDAVRAG